MDLELSAPSLRDKRHESVMNSVINGYTRHNLMAEFMSRQLLMPPKKCGVTKSSSSVNKSGIIKQIWYH
jgi:hypothetical protein